MVPAQSLFGKCSPHAFEASQRALFLSETPRSHFMTSWAYSKRSSLDLSLNTCLRPEHLAAQPGQPDKNELG